MENDPFGRKGPETPDDDTDDDSSSKKKKKNKRLPLFTPPPESTEESSEAEAPAETKKTGNAAEQLWRRVTGQPEADKESDTESDEHVDDDMAETAEQEHETPLESLSDAEQLEVTEAYIAARQAALLEEQSMAVEGEDEAAVQERAANIALLDAMRRLLHRDHAGEEPASEPLEEAYDSTVHQLGFSEAAAGPHPEDADVPEVETEPQSVPEPEVLPLTPAATVTLHAERYREAEDAPAPRVPETTPVFQTQETSDERQDSADQRRRTGSALLVGGLVGYFVGRRRGRITTEKKFKAVEAKLTKQIEQVQQTVVQKEQQIRRLARETYEAKAVRPVSPRVERVATKTEKQPLLRTEQLGLVTLKAAEAPRRPEVVAATPAKTAKVEKLAPTKKVESLSRPELLAVASEIKVGATDLRRVFETNLVSEMGLRRLVMAHERGENIRPNLEREITEKEMSYERDPRLRNSAVMGSLAARNVVRADIDKPAPATPVTPSSDDASSTRTDEPTSSTRSTGTPPVAVAAVVTLVVVIAVLLVILFTSR